MRLNWKTVIPSALGLGAALGGGIAYLSQRWSRVVTVSLASSKIPKGHNLRILHLSDLHSRSPHHMHVDIWQEVQKLDADVAVITGDLFVNTPDELAPHLPGLQSLATRMPVFFVEGNHDMYYSKVLKPQLESIGIHPLYNQALHQTINGMDCTFLGLRDHFFWEGRHYSGFNHLPSRMNPGSFNVVLLHQPQLFKRIAPFSPDLTLAGHTHGGQLRLPFCPTLYAPQQGFLPAYGNGWHWEKGCPLYISRGIGATHFPFRFWNLPEITVINVCHEG